MNTLTHYLLAVSLLVQPPGITNESSTPPHRIEPQTALSLAIRSLDVDGVKAALKAGADPNARISPENSETPLELASSSLISGSGTKEQREQRVIKVIEALVGAGGKFSFSGRGSTYPAAISGSTAALARMLELGADPNAGNAIQESLAAVSLMYAHEDCFNVLLKAGAKRPAPRLEALYRLIGAIQTCNQDECRRIVESTNGDVLRSQSARGDTALGFAIEQLRFNCLFPRDEAMRMKCRILVPIVSQLLKAGADPNQNHLSQTPLCLLVGISEEHWNDADGATILQLLISSGAKVAKVDDLGSQPIHIAAISGNVSAAKLLIAAGAKVMTKDRSGKTPLDLTESGEMVKLLKANGATER
jgi:ankyrin repeat protein